MLDDPLPHHPHLPIWSIDADNPLLVKQLKVGTLMEIAVVQDHAPIATPLFLGAYLQVLVESHSYLRLPSEETLDLNAAIEVRTKNVTLRERART